MRTEMDKRSLKRMDEIAEYYAREHGVLAVAAFGSNAERGRFDAYSDLDFLVFSEPTAKERLLSTVNNLESICPIDGVQICFGDAVKLLFSDGVLCDYGIILPEQLSTFPHGAGRYLWVKNGWDAIGLEANEPVRRTAQELQNSVLFHLYTGLLRAMRGEEAAAFEEIQVQAAQDMLRLMEGEKANPFTPIRRAEETLDTAQIGALMPGYGHSREAAESMLKLLDSGRNNLLHKAVKKLLAEGAREKQKSETER